MSNWDEIKDFAVVRALLGCSWGTAVTTPDDTAVCDERAVKIVVLHQGERSFDIRLCQRHLDIVTEHTSPSEDMCSLCEQNKATTAWGVPVCQPCYDHLIEIDVTLRAEEVFDPDLAAKGRAVDEAFDAFLKERDGES